MDSPGIAVTDVIRALSDASAEGQLYEMSAELRRDGLAALRENPPNRTGDRRSAIDRGTRAIGVILANILPHRDAFSGEAGHGSGHWCRDFAHALRLVHDPEIPVSAIVPALVSGTLHDIGTLFFDRYADRTRAVRHAEAGALVARAALRQSNVLTPEEADATAYAMAAHTNYLKSEDVRCADGVTRTVHPYIDTADGSPLLPVWMTRWADRLDCNGPCFPARHYLSLHRDHHDFGSDGFYSVSFADHMVPSLRGTDEIRAAGGKRTFLEHLQMFAESQADDSPYGRFDRGVMRVLRDEYRASLEHIIDRVVQPTDVNPVRTMKAWTLFLGSAIEPSPIGRMAAQDLSLSFHVLDPDVQRAWACGFRTAMSEYLVWSDRMLTFLDKQPAEHLRIPGLFADVRDVIKPSLIWLATLVI
ncbi:hypothetical protein HY479_01630 [Candidatus Uhrbacteria bacterium]|nr:hypothetical protein [Candidatus Uhrbacteria bacterium]